MFASRSFRLCPFCIRVVSRSGGGTGEWRTFRSHTTSLIHANFTKELQQNWGVVVPKRHCQRDLEDLYNNHSVQRYLQQLMEEFKQVSEKLQHVFLSESARKTLVMKHAELLPLSNVCETIEQARKELEEVNSLLQSEYSIGFECLNVFILRKCSMKC